MSIAFRETIIQSPYKDVLTHELKRKNPAFGEIFSYNRDGELYFNKTGLKIVDLLKKHGEPYDAPIQITDLTKVTERAGQLKKIFRESAQETGYLADKFQVHYATKANAKGPVVMAALKEVDVETTAELDLFNIQRMRRRGFIKKDIKIISNGFKVRNEQKFDKGYGHRIIDLFNEGADITPVLCQNELPFFQENVKSGIMNVGLRLKYGQIDNDRDLGRLVSRFGFDWEELQTEAEKIKNSPHLEFTMLHAMISAAHTVEPQALAKSALFAAEKWAKLKQMYPKLTHLNFGGGFPTIDSGYDHKAFLKTYLSGVKEICKRYGVELPTIVVESGSFIATDTEHLVYKVTENNTNSIDGAPWITVNGILTNLPDIWVQEDAFTFVAANHADSPLVGVRVGDVTCDSNNVYPPKDQPTKLIQMPNKFDGLVIVAINTGAYQDAISGVSSQKEAKLVNHCGQAEPIQVYIGKNGKVWSNTRASMEEMSNIAGYSDEMLSLAK